MTSKLLAALLGAAATLAIGSVAGATIPDAAGVIHACVKNGEPRIVDTEVGESCKATEQALDWNAQGPPGPIGPQGAQGPQGVQGPQGETGPAGLSGYEVVHLEVGGPVIGPGEKLTYDVGCPGLKFVISAGYKMLFGDRGLVITDSRPFGFNVWRFIVYMPDQPALLQGPDGLTDLWAVCASVG